MEFKVFETQDYSIFKTVKGNRNINQAHVAQLAMAMMSYGWEGSPIQVNRKMQIIDGQHRLEAAKIANIAVPYYITKNANIDTAVRSNILMKNWTFSDYVNRYISEGNKNYEMLEELKNKYHASYDQTLRALNIGASNRARLKDGTLKISMDAYNKADHTLKKSNEMKDALDEIRVRGGSGSIKNTATMFLAENYEDDILDRIVKAIRKSSPNQIDAVDTQSLLDSIERVYNRGIILKNRIYFGEIYKHTQNAKAAIVRHERRYGTSEE